MSGMTVAAQVDSDMVDGSIQTSSSVEYLMSTCVDQSPVMI